jgi:hypothetical protein
VAFLGRSDVRGFGVKDVDIVDDVDVFVFTKNSANRTNKYYKFYVSIGHKCLSIDGPLLNLGAA